MLHEGSELRSHCASSPGLCCETESYITDLLTPLLHTRTVVYVYVFPVVRSRRTGSRRRRSSSNCRVMATLNNQRILVNTWQVPLRYLLPTRQKLQSRSPSQLSQRSWKSSWVQTSLGAM